MPILLSSVFVFIASSIIHMLLPYHRTDKGQVPEEDKIMTAMRDANIQPGEYYIPRSSNPNEMWTEELIEKMKQGPVGVLTVMPSGPPDMRKSLLQWFIYILIVSVFTAYITTQAVPPDGDYLKVFRVAGAVSVLGYCFATWHDTIWWGQSWSTNLKFTFDGLIYGLLTAGTFGWLWH